MTPGPDDETPGLADALAIIDAQRARAEATRPSGSLLFGLWGTVWFVGYGGVWLTSRDGSAPSVLAGVVAIVGGVIAVAVTIVHVLHRTRGIAGTSARQGAMYGWAWPVGFVAQSMIVGGLGRAGRRTRSPRSRPTRSPPWWSVCCTSPVGCCGARPPCTCSARGWH
jgi:hypothetical protein